MRALTEHRDNVPLRRRGRTMTRTRTAQLGEQATDQLVVSPFRVISTRLSWWMRIVGGFYLLQFVMNAFVRAPIRAVGPEGVLAQAALGDTTARFLVDTWITFGLEIGAIGAALLVFSRRPAEAKALVWTIIGIELTRGITNDIYMIASGYDTTVFAVWIVIHTAIIATALFALRRPRPVQRTASAARPL